MKKFLLDTDICIYFLKGLYNLDTTIKKAGIENCFISEITLAELTYGAANSKNPAKSYSIVSDFREKFHIIPIFKAIDIYAKEKARLRKKGTILDDFDILIGATAITHNLTMVTNNVSDLQRLEGIVIENWAREVVTP